MDDQTEDLVLRSRPEEGERLRVRPPESPSIHYTQLPEGPSDSPIAVEWNLYRRIVGQLLADGHEGKWLLIKNNEIVGMWDTQAETDVVRLERFPTQPVLLKQILAREPILRIGYNRLCRS